MIVDCPACSARFRFAAERHAGKRIRLRCSRCREVFAVEVAAAPHVLVAHSDPSLCATVTDLLSEVGISSETCHSGNDALAAMALRPPDVALVDVALPGLYAFEIVDKVRALPGLDRVKVILLSSVYNKAAYKRRPTSLYGADDYIEKHHIPDDLVRKVLHLSSGRRPEPPGGPESETQQQAWDAVNERLQQAENEEVRQTRGFDLGQARRLARIVASDIALYHQDKVEEGIRSGRFFDLMATEIREGERLFIERFGDRNGIGHRLLREAFEELIASRRIGEQQ
ncbi:response regulator [Geothermobacter hydrogeniphilus]|uniref:Response regulatory domain-containing protein n=1 Tax=Geothermobacter hydrogeniphilus TaxID=1969733 RepID=A0A1X0YEX3_9BACT|nr:response regulator [Geothermobacter hydrogeniphilus]ORJ63642.1 hypothetical protein B5V00_00310 [Geothermobacter hydrogeniphilus]